MTFNRLEKQIIDLLKKRSLLSASEISEVMGINKTLTLIVLGDLVKDRAIIVEHTEFGSRYLVV